MAASAEKPLPFSLTPELSVPSDPWVPGSSPGLFRLHPLVHLHMPSQLHSWKMDPIIWIRQELQKESNKQKCKDQAHGSPEFPAQSNLSKRDKGGKTGSEGEGDQYEAANLSSQHNA